MLRSLHIENIAVIKSVDIDFADGFSAFTGETGAGKSVVIGCINLILGKKADKELIRRGESTAEVHAFFDNITSSTAEALAGVGVDVGESRELSISRTITADEGRSRIKVNGRSVGISQLREIGSLLVSIHGQNDTRILSDESNHITVLDNYAGISNELSEYRKIYSQLLEVNAALEELDTDDFAKRREAEMLSYQIKEIESHKLKVGEEEKLAEKRDILRSAERIKKQAGFAYRALLGNEKANASYIIERAAASMALLSDIISDAEEISKQLYDCKYAIDDLAERSLAVCSEIEGDPVVELDRVESRLDAIDKLKKKYGGSIERILEFYEDAKLRLSKIEGADDERIRLNEIKKELISQAYTVAERISGIREEVAARLSQSVTEVIGFLDMPKTKFYVSLSKPSGMNDASFDSNGFNKISFMIAPNAGDDYMPMAKIASGGELARIMLALKSVITNGDGVNTVIFDEIDSGVSGKTSRKIGMKLKELAGESQIICVTHSAQIASVADSHFLISKFERDKRTESEIIELGYEERVAEIARILGGINITDAQRRAAVDMLSGNDINDL